MSSSRIRRVIVRLPAGVSVQDYWDLRGRIEALHGNPVLLKVNDNSSTLLSVKFGRNGQPPTFSVHRMFIGCSEEVVKALATYVASPTAHSNAVLRKFMNQRTDDIRSALCTGRRIRLRARGNIYNLHEMAQQVNDEFFEGQIKAYISWSRGRVETRSRRRHIMFGSYDHKSQLIKIHPALDNTQVPAYFVKFVIFHEMLHALLQPQADADGRRSIHSAKFRKLEKAHPDYARCMAWERKFMGKE